MSRRTIRATDLLCDVSNWNNSLSNAVCPCELTHWTKLRDKKLASLRRVVTSFTPEDVAYIRRKAPKLEAKFLSVGVSLTDQS